MMEKARCSMLIATFVVLTTLATPIEHCGFFGENDDKNIYRGESISCNGMSKCNGPECEFEECNAICDGCEECEGFSFISDRRSGQGPVCDFKTNLSANEEFGDFRAEEYTISSGWEMFANSRATGGSCPCASGCERCGWNWYEEIWGAGHPTYLTECEPCCQGHGTVDQISRCLERCQRYSYPGTNPFPSQDRTKYYGTDPNLKGVEHCGFVGNDDDQSIYTEEVGCGYMRELRDCNGCDLAECNSMCDSCYGCEGFIFISDRQSGEGPVCVWKTQLSKNDELGNFRDEELTPIFGWEVYVNSRATGGSCTTTTTTTNTNSADDDRRLIDSGSHGLSVSACPMLLVVFAWMSACAKTFCH